MPNAAELRLPNQHILDAHRNIPDERGNMGDSVRMDSTQQRLNAEPFIPRAIAMQASVPKDNTANQISSSGEVLKLELKKFIFIKFVKGENRIEAVLFHKNQVTTVYERYMFL